MADVFVSYKAEDRKRVQPLVAALEADDLTVWWDAHVAGASSWRSSIEAELEKAKCVIVVWSRRSVGPEGSFVRDEASRALERGVYIPIKVDNVRPPLGFGETQALSLVGWKGDAADPRYRAVSDCVRSMLGREGRDREAPLAQPPHTIDRRTAIAVGAAAVVATGAAGWLLFRRDPAKANTIAVLPFANLSGDPSQAYFSDGIAEEIRSALATLGGLEVVARTSSEMLRDVDAIAASKRLSVANVVTGSVRRSPSTVRVSAQLVDGTSGIERWSESFDRPFGDVLQLQSDIAANVARSLSVALRGSSNVLLSLGGTANAQAQDFLLQATALEGDDSGAAGLRRIALLQRAIELDPNYGEAHARKGLYQSLWANAWAPSNAERYRAEAEAFQSVSRALKIAPAMPLGYAAVGVVHLNQLAMKRALHALRRSAELPGADTFALFNYALVLSRVLRPREAQMMIERAIALDPLNPIARLTQSWILFNGRQYAAWIPAAQEALKVAPRNRGARALVAWSLILLGRIDEAERELQKLPEDDYRRLVAEGVIAARSQAKHGALRSIRILQQRYGETMHYQFAEVYAQLGDTDKAFLALQAALAARDSGLASLQVDPFIDPVRNDPRLTPITRRVFG